MQHEFFFYLLKKASNNTINQLEFTIGLGKYTEKNLTPQLINHYQDILRLIPFIK